MGKVFKIVGKSLPGLYGEMEPKKLQITMDPAFSGEGNLEDTLLHELFHAVESHAGLEYNEDWVRPVASGIFSVLRDNPALIRFLLGPEVLKQVFELEYGNGT